MNYTVRSRLLGRVFVDAQTLLLSRSDAQSFAAANLGEGYQLALVRDQGDPAAQQRPAFVSSTGDRMLALLPGSFDFTALPLDAAGSNLSDLGGFAGEAAQVLARCATSFGRVPYRLVLAQEGYLREMSADELSRIANRVLHLPKRAIGKDVFEWDWRVATRERIPVGDGDEEANYIVTLRRGPAPVVDPVSGARGREALRMEIDVNTTNLDTRGRFYTERISVFFARATEAHAALSRETQEMVEG